MRVRLDTRLGRLTIRWDEPTRATFDTILDRLCTGFNCELIGRNYAIGECRFQDVLCKYDWRMYTLEIRMVEKLYFGRKRAIRLLGRRLSILTLQEIGYSKESLRAMGAKTRSEYVLRSSPCGVITTVITATTTP